MDLVPLTAIDKADTAWVMVAAALVLLMTLPGIALFYAGLVRRKNVVNTMAAVFAVACVVTLTWFGIGYSLAFTADSPWLGNLSRAWFASLHIDVKRNVLSVNYLAPHLPEAAYALFQAAFAIITTSLIVELLSSASALPPCWCLRHCGACWSTHRLRIGCGRAATG